MAQTVAIPLPKRLKRFLRYLLVRVSVFVVARLPVSFAGELGRRLGGWAFSFSRRDRGRALDSLAQAFPEASESERLVLARDSFEHLGQCLFELACVEQIDADIDTWVAWPADDRTRFDTLFKRGRGVIFVSGHVGNWELLARRIAMAGYPAQTIAKETTDRRLTGLVERFRAAGRLKSLWRGRDGAAKGMLRAIKSGEILGILIDQDTDVQSVFVPFFGKPASTPRAAADLALRTGAPVVLGFCHRTHSGHYAIRTNELKFTPSGDREKDVSELTAAMTQEIESAIRSFPSQWVWMHRRWKTTPPPA